MTCDPFCCPFLLPIGEWEEMQDLGGPENPGSSLLVWPQAGHPASLGLGFFLCKLEVTRGGSQSYHEGSITWSRAPNTQEALNEEFPHYHNQQQCLCGCIKME